jgi:ATP-binding cassette subfamily F protein uup
MGWDLEPRLKEACTTWGLADLEAEVESLSGGWRKRVALAQAWLRDPDVLVLDEPTNHLDPDQVERLQTWLQQFDGALLLITHDRHLLDAVVTRMLELDEGRVTTYEGSYSDYLLEKADREFRQARLTEHMQNRLRREMAWLRRGAKARTRKSKLRIEEALNLKDEVQERTRPAHKLEISFLRGSTRSDALLITEKLCFAYDGEKELIGSFDLILQKGMRLALLGPNGCGKSTLLKLLLGDLQATSGSVVRHSKLRVSAISQGREELDLSASILENLSGGSGVVQCGDQSVQAHVYLARFGFPVDQQQRAASSLSGGERNRLLLAKAMLRPADLLVLDEPTNDLDITTLQNLEEALMDFPGALLLVSHDRFFLDQVSTHTIAWNTGGLPRWELYEGNPSTVRSLRDERAASRPQGAPPQASKARQPESPKARKAGLSQKEQRRLVEVEAAVADLENRITALDVSLHDPMAFASADAPGHQALKERETLKGQLDVLETEWMALEEKKVIP